VEWYARGKGLLKNFICGECIGRDVCKVWEHSTSLEGVPGHRTTVGFDGRVRRSRLQLRCSLALARKKGREVAGGAAGDLALFSEVVWREEEDRVVGASLV
jgi:hypothetical protein